MPDYRLKIAMAQNGRSSRDTHSIVFRVSPTGAFSRPQAKQLALDFVAALAAVMFQSTNFLRATFVQLDANGAAVKNSNFSVPLALTGFNAYGAGDGSAHEQICLAVEKGAQLGKAGITLLRHTLSAQEYADYLNSGDVPARFTASPATTYNAGHSLGDNLKKALDDNDFNMVLPPVMIGGVATTRTVETIAAQDFRVIRATKRRRSAESEIADGVQREINAMARKAWKLWNKFLNTVAPPDVIAAIASLIQLAAAAYTALPALERILVTPPTFPALP